MNAAGLPIAMPNHSSLDIESLRAEIAVAAARMIAEDGADYGTAKRKAANQILGNKRIHGDMLPDNAQIEEEVRIYHELFFGETQPLRLLALRKLALELMINLEQFQPVLTGAVANGTAGEHSEIYLQLFSDNPKEVALHLINQNIRYDISESHDFKGRNQPIETLSFLWRNEGAHLSLYQTDDLRGALKSSEAKRPVRLTLEGLRTLIAQTETGTNK